MEKASVFLNNFFGGNLAILGSLICNITLTNTYQRRVYLRWIAWANPPSEIAFIEHNQSVDEYFSFNIIKTLMNIVLSEAGRHNLRGFLAANSTQNYFLIARMLRFL